METKDTRGVEMERMNEALMILKIEELKVFKVGPCSVINSAGLLASLA